MAPAVSVLSCVGIVVSRSTFFVALAGLAATTRAGEALQPADLPPTMQAVAQLERGLILPKDAYPLTAYTRHYATVRHGGRIMVRGVFVGGPPKVVIEKSESDLPGIFDGGCHVVNILYDMKSLKIVQVFCNGYA